MVTYCWDPQPKWRREGSRECQEGAKSHEQLELRSVGDERRDGWNKQQFFREPNEEAPVCHESFGGGRIMQRYFTTREHGQEHYQIRAVQWSFSTQKRGGEKEGKRYKHITRILRRRKKSLEAEKTWVITRISTCRQDR